MKGSIRGIEIRTRVLELGTAREVSELKPSSAYEHEISVGRYLELWPEEIQVKSIATNPSQVGYVSSTFADRWEFSISLDPSSTGIVEICPIKCEKKLGSYDHLDMTFLTRRISDTLRLSLRLRIT